MAFETKKGTKEIPLPRQAEIICICTEMPDQAQTAEARKGAKAPGH